MPSVSEEQPTLHDALESLHEASLTPAKQRSVKVSGVVDVICRHAFDDGLDQEALRIIIQIASVKTNLDQTSVTTLIKNLYPAQRVPGDVVVTVVGALGQGRGKPTPGTQDSLVKWLTIIHEIVENPSILSRLYGVLFGMLDMISIRTSLCHLLSLITRRKHVKPFRMQQLLELSRGLGNEPALQGLLRVYKDYYPDIILGSTSLSRKSFAPQPDAEWQTKISAIQEAITIANDSTLDRHNGFKVLRRGPKRSKVSAIPDVHTYHATENSVTLEGIDSVEDFVEKLDRIEPPGQLISFLTDPLLQKYVDLRPSPIISSRIDLWLATCLEDQYEIARQGTGDSRYLSEVLDGLLKHAQYTKTLHPAVLAFLQQYLGIWNGRDHVNTLLGLLVYIPFESFEDAYSTYLVSLEQALVTQGPSSCEKLVNFYSSLLRHQTSSSSPDQRALKDFTTHIATFSTSIILTLPANSGSSLISSILSFYELLSTCSKPYVIPITLPPMHLVYLLVQDAPPATLSRTCGIIGSYKLAFDQHPKPVKNYYSTAVTDALNWCLRDIYNFIWVSRALVVSDQKAVGLYCQPSLRSALNDYLSSLSREYGIGAALALSNNPALASLSAAAWRTIEERNIEQENLDITSTRRHQGPVSQQSLHVLKRQGGVSVDWDGPLGYKVFVLQWLEERGMGGIKELMFATVTDLKGKIRAMKFGTTLRKSVYPPWKGKYIDYDKLKKLLKDSDEEETWTADDEQAFVDELANVQLENVHNFIQEVSQKLRDRTSACEKKLEPLAVGIPSEDQGEEKKKKDEAGEGEASKKSELGQEEREKLLNEVLAELDDITKETKELEGFSRINFTAVIKATKKHDKLRGQSYRLRPFIDARIAEQPLQTEDASPLLYRLSALYSFVRQSLEGKPKEALSFAEGSSGGESFVSHKFWVHMDNLFEVKTVILRRLPVLVYNSQTSKVADSTQRDPTITSIYFDNPNFSLYTDKVNGKPDAASLRLRWYGQLGEKPEIVFEKKVIKEGNASEEVRFPIKGKYVQAFLEDKYHMEKSIEKLEYRPNKDQNQVDKFKKAVQDIQSFVKEKSLQPVLRANYTRTAFQIPGDDRVRISLDTNLALIREDALDMDRPCRDPDDWHRRDIDSGKMEFPFKAIKKGEVNKFPYALLEIKVKGVNKYEWVEDLMNSHLVQESPRFSKFVQGVAKLFEDNVNTFPFWLSQVDNDIRKEPSKAIADEEERKRRAAENDVAVGSLFGARASPSYRSSVIGSPAVSRSAPKRSASAAIANSGGGTAQSMPRAPINIGSLQSNNNDRTNEELDSDEDDIPEALNGKRTGLASLFPSFSTSKYARKQQRRIQLPPGIRDPGVWIKDQGPVRVEAKVWLANQRTFIKWQHVSVLLASLSLGLYNAAGEGNNIARALAVVYTSIAAFTLAWGYGMYMWRNKLIRERSGKDFDGLTGPLVVCVGLAVALCLNFGFKYRALMNEKDHHHGHANASFGEQTELRV
ncbi:Mis6-domain-containing protein [Dothidotthia symphoricarpi CBS 119687]|uniref:Mis6-domain-containing protein n=1 Tax=Dothidotthia symphoricarpi CBS 119687 TaxID=1392245 RepID=A0A6A6AAZ5_9PLEO|nr:Mis6-domain-containing protein [Dothidotthia symphoricarpi CBS 119687]KAF2129000.1 Mis6-domain-containing protein [Dothidotthia symphoricarpi CBS 119687]